MPRIEILPHQTAPPTAWQRGGWTVAIDGNPPRPARDVLNGWDYDSSLTFRSETVVDVDALHSACGTEPAEVHLDLVSLWDCPATAVRSVGHRHTLGRGGQERVTAIFGIPSQTIAQRVSVERQVVVASASSKPDDPRIPSAPGSVVLWEREEETTSIALEGIGGRFPTEALNFSQMRYPAAAWRLSLTYDDPDDSFLSAARLHLNLDHPAIAELLGDPKSPAAAKILSVLKWDTTRQLLTQVARDDRIRQTQYEEGSVGDVIDRIARSIFRKGSSEYLFELLRGDPEQFEALLQDRLRLLQDG